MGAPKWSNPSGGTSFPFAVALVPLASSIPTARNTTLTKLKSNRPCYEACLGHDYFNGRFTYTGTLSKRCQCLKNTICRCSGPLNGALLEGPLPSCILSLTFACRFDKHLHCILSKSQQLDCLPSRPQASNITVLPGRTKMTHIACDPEPDAQSKSLVNGQSPFQPSLCRSPGGACACEAFTWRLYNIAAL